MVVSFLCRFDGLQYLTIHLSFTDTHDYDSFFHIDEKKKITELCVDFVADIVAGILVNSSHSNSLETVKIGVSWKNVNNCCSMMAKHGLVEIRSKKELEHELMNKLHEKIQKVMQEQCDALKKEIEQQSHAIDRKGSLKYIVWQTIDIKRSYML